MEVVDVRALASGHVTSLDLDADGTPQRPLVVVDAGAPAPDDVAARAAAVAAAALPIVVGVADVVDQSSRAVVDALTFTFCRSAADAGVASRCIVDPDPVDAARRLASCVGAAPRAAVVLGQVLRATAQLAVRDALAAEAAAYSMMLAGPEFRAWLARRGPRRPTATDAGLPVRVARVGDRLSVVLDRPDRRNAFSVAMREALVEALAVAVADEDVDVDLAGEGADFCSGGDLDEFGTATDVGAAYLVRLERCPGWFLHQLATRVTVHAHGACVGAGVELAAFAGHVTATPSSFFALPEVSMGLIPGAGGTVSIPRRIGRWRTAWLALTGERLSAETALDWGLVDSVAQ